MALAGVTKTKGNVHTPFAPMSRVVLLFILNFPISILWINRASSGGCISCGSRPSIVDKVRICNAEMIEVHSLDQGIEEAAERGELTELVLMVI